MAWKTEIFADGTWVGNLRFATGAEAKSYVADLKLRRTAVRHTRVVECSGPVNSTYNVVRHTGFGGLGLLGWRRKHKSRAAAV